MSRDPSFRVPDVGVIEPVSELAAALERVPRAARWVLPAWAAAFRGTSASTIEPRIRALVLLRVAAADRTPYWRTQLESVAPDLGITRDELTLVGSGEWETAPAFADRERAAILWADRVARRLARRDRRAFETVRASFSEDELVELTLVAALASMAGRFTNAMRIAPEPPIGLSPTVDPVPDDAFAAWIERMFATSGAGPSR